MAFARMRVISGNPTGTAQGRFDKQDFGRLAHSTLCSGIAFAASSRQRRRIDTGSRRHYPIPRVWPICQTSIVFSAMGIVNTITKPEIVISGRVPSWTVGRRRR
jgi:hypothetical protein